MKSLKTILFSLALGGALTMSLPAFADGIAARPAQLSDETRASLVKEIDAYRAAHPEAFEAVRNVKGHRPEVYKNYRNPIPTATREFRGLGASALLPMLEALAFQAPARGGLTDAEWDALTVGMVEAVGILRDARSGPVLEAIFEGGSQRPAVLAATGRAIGRLGGDAQLATLVKHATAGDPLRMHAIAGLGQLRRVESAKQLAALLSSAKDDATAAATAEALGTVGSSWAWKAMGPQAAAAGLAVREVAAKALMSGFVRYRGETRGTLRDAVLMTEHPQTVDMIHGARASADAATARDSDLLLKRVERQQKR